MACNTETQMIGDHEYSVTQWSADKAMLMKFKLTKVLGSALAQLANQDGDTDAEALSKSLSSLFDNNSPEEIVATIKSCVIGVAMDGTRITESSYAKFGADDLLEIYQVFLFVLKTNFSNLFKGQLADRFLAKVKANL